MKKPDEDDRLGRREFLQRGALAGLGMSVLPLRASAQPAEEPGRAYSATRRSAAPACGCPTSPSARAGWAPVRETLSGTRSTEASTTSTPRTATAAGTGDDHRDVLRGKRDRVYIASKTYTSPGDVGAR